MTDSLVSKPHRAPADSAEQALWTGLYTGALLMIVMIGALVAANRIPGLERYALERNGISYSLFTLFMMIPVCRFLTRPWHMFTSAMIGWLIFVVAYDLAGIYFANLFQVLRNPFQVLIEGAIVYGVFAVGSWVGEMILHARRHPMAPSRRRTNDASHRP